MLRTFALKVPLALALTLVFAAPGFAQSTARFADFSYLRSDLRSLDQRVEDFITDVRAGNRQAFKYVQYETLEAAVVRLKRLADEYPALRQERNDRTMRYLVATTNADDEQARATLTRATLPGIFNMDPRVRLVAADWLRGIRPDASMQRAVKLAVGVDINVIRYDHQRGEFVFRAPRIIETVASANEYYREKDLDWPTSYQVGGPGPNNDEDLLYQGAPQLRDGPRDNTTTGLSARRWGDFAPRYDPERGYVPLTEAEQTEIMEQWTEALRLAEERAQARYGGDVYAPDLDQYRRYPLEGARDEENVREDAELLMEQYGNMGAMVPLGQGDKYVYLNRHGQLLLGSPWTELTKLDEFITRKVWWEKIRAGQRNVMTYLSKDTFSTLFRSIDGEIPEVIPMLSFATANPMIEQNNARETDRVVDVLIVGLHRNPVLSNKYVILRALKDIYEDQFGALDTTPAIREKINVALWEFRRECNRLDLVVGRELTAESITVDKRPANDWVPIAPVGAVVDELETVLDLGFRLPNDEILAASYRLISSDPTNEADANREPRVNIDELFSSMFYAFRRPDNTLITWFNNRTEWTARAAGQNITANIDRVDSNWIYNYEQMERAQGVINGILAGDPDVLRTAEWPDVQSAIVLTLKRVQLQYALGAANAAMPITTFMDQLRREVVVIDNVNARNNPELRSKIFTDLQQEAREETGTTMSFSEEKREAIKESALGGLFNRDPRIRLTAIHFLRRIGPDESMMDAVIRSRSIVAGADPASTVPETDDYLNMFIDTNVYTRDKSLDFVTEMRNRYRGVIPDERLKMEDETLQYDIINPRYNVQGHEYQMGLISKLPGEQPAAGAAAVPVRFYGIYQLKSPGEELDKLYRFIQRRRLVRAIKRGDVNTITRMSRSDFGILSEFIDDEYAARVPFASFHTIDQDRSSRTAVPSKFAIFNDADIAVIKRGIDSTNFLVQKGTCEFLINFYNFYTGFNADHSVKREIRDAMYFYKQDDIAVEEFVLAFEGENPDGRSVIMAGTSLSRDLNPGGERVYRTLPDNILMDIRDAVLDETTRLPDALRAILGMITVRATEASANPNYTSRDMSATVRNAPNRPEGTTVTPPNTGGNPAPAPAPPAAG